MNIPAWIPRYRPAVSITVNLPPIPAPTLAVMPIELEALANETIQVLVEEIERLRQARAHCMAMREQLRQEREDCIIALSAMIDAFSPDLYRVVAAGAGRSGDADAAHALARRVLEKYMAK